MNRREKEIQPTLLYLLSFLIPVILMVAALAGLGVVPFGNHTLLTSDGDALYVNYLGYLARAVRGQEDILYSFQKSIGGNMMDSWGWFLLNPFFVLVSLFDVTRYPLAFTIISVLNCSICGLTMYILLGDVRGHKIGNLIFSTSYALIGFNVANVFQMNFFTGVCALPLMALGLRRILQNGNPLIYILSLAYSLFTNFYFGFMLCVASVLIFGTFWITEGSAFPNRRSATVKYIVSSILAGLISSVEWLPALLALRGGRLDQTGAEIFTFQENMPFLEIAAKLFTGRNTYSQLQDGLPNIFVGILPVLLVILFFINGKIERKKKCAAGILLGAYLLSFYIVAFNLLMHGGTVTNWFNYRYSFVFSFILLCIASCEWDYFLDAPFKDLKKAVTILAVTTIIVFSKQYDFVSGGEILLDYLILALILTFYWMYRIRPDKIKKTMLVLTSLVLVSANLLLNYRISVNSILKYESTVGEYEYTVTPVSAMVEAVQTTDHDFYRMEVGEQRSESEGNDPMLFGYDGVGHGGSDYRDFVRTALCRLGIHRWNMRNFYADGVPAASDSLFGLRYIISKKDLTAEKNYKALSSLGDWRIFKNPYALPIAMAANEEIKDVSIMRADVFSNLNKTWSALSGDIRPIFVQEKNISFTSHNMTDPRPIEYKDAAALYQKRYGGTADESDEAEADDLPENTAYIEYSWIATEDGPVYCYNEAGVSEEFGAKTPMIIYIGNYHKGDAIKGYLSVGEDFVTPETLENVAGQFCAVYVNMDALAEMSSLIQNRPTDIEKLTDSHLRGSFTLEDGQLLLFSIPWDEGWTCRIDGEKVEIEKSLSLFMTVTASPGEHTFELRFVPAGLKTGLILIALSLVGLITFLVLLRMINRYHSGSPTHENGSGGEEVTPQKKQSTTDDMREVLNNGGTTHFSRFLRTRPSPL